MTSRDDDAADAGRSPAVVDLLAAEQSRGVVLERRCTGVLARSGTFVTLLALAVVATRPVGLPLGVPAVLTASLIAFVAGAVLAMLASASRPPQRRTKHAISARGRTRSDHATDSVVTPVTELDHLTAWRRSNELRSWIVLGAGAAEVLGVLFLAVATAAML